MANKEWAQKLEAAIKESSWNQFQDESYGLEYIVECEEQEGIEYWDQFKSENEALQDFIDYCEAIGLYDPE